MELHTFYALHKQECMENTLWLSYGKLWRSYKVYKASIRTYTASVASKVFGNISRATFTSSSLPQTFLSSCSRVGNVYMAICAPFRITNGWNFASVLSYASRQTVPVLSSSFKSPTFFKNSRIKSAKTTLFCTFCS